MELNLNIYLTPSVIAKIEIMLIFLEHIKKLSLI